MSRIQINPQCVVCKRWSVVALWNARPTNDTICIVLFCIVYDTMRGQPTIQYVLYCCVLYTIQCEANQRAPTRHYDPSGCPLHCTCAAMVCSATFLSCHLTRAVCSIMSMIFFSDLVIGRTILLIHAIRVLAESRVASFNLRVES